MLITSKKMQLFILLILAIIIISAFIVACSKSDDDDGDPEIVGCNSVKYKGYTFTNIGCAIGIVSFDITTTQNGHKGSFHITCSNGCISSVTVLSGANAPLMEP